MRGIYGCRQQKIDAERTKILSNLQIGIRRKIGRRERIRTSGPYVPNVVLYQAELLSDQQAAA
jgi:hypothetical protein